MSSFSLKFFLILISIQLLNVLVESRKDKIKLKDIEVLTLKPNQWTTGRRTKPVPQLQCVGGYCDAIKGETVQCYNRGSDGLDVQWECKSNIKNDYKFGSLDVICEGYDFPDDPYVLIGSCGLEYTIESVANKQKGFFSSDDSYSPLKSKPSNGFSFGFILCLCVLVFIIYYTCLRPNGLSNNRDSQNTRSPPPPPGFRSDFFDSSSSSGPSSGFFTGRADNTRDTRNTGNNGFFSGLLAGGTLGYLFGSRNNTNYRNQSSYFGRRADPPSYFSSDSTRSSPSKTTTSGFAGTKRR